ncbi:MAG TPA: fumarylacetoacetate hydrolase family protein [Solirubrobacterales bacterium]|nr:fumarylacetoacetate hydrolase family protein [Solirubrobacterales bacterium]
MPIARYAAGEEARLGVVRGEQVFPLDLGPRPGAGVEALFDLGPEAVAAAVAAATADPLALDEVRLLAPVPRPSKIFGVGLNYAQHIAELDMQRTDTPTVFAKFPSSVTGPGAPIYRPRISVEVDYEVELCVVIGKPVRNVPVERAMAAIGGYMILDDVSVRDWQFRTRQWSLGKSFDSHCPIGPWLTLADEVDPADLSIRTWVNDELRQDARTSALIFDCAELVAHLSRFCTLFPGDLIATGTPSGVAAGMDPPAWLVPGDEVRMEIEGLGTLVNPVVEEPDDLGRG